MSTKCNSKILFFIQVILHSSVEADLYDSPIVVDRGRPINPDMLFDSSQMFLYVMSDRKVSTAKYQQVFQYNYLT